jgi:dolichyl-phosphate-mannose-protein mannosyltransferase
VEASSETKLGKSPRKSQWLDALLLFTFSFALFRFGLDNIAVPIFDEIYYVPAAFNWLHKGDVINIEHPPLGKFLIAAGIGTFGNNAIGWRVMGAVFGAITIAGTYVLSTQLFADRRVAWVSALITLFNGLIFVQSRVAMLDVFMVGFLVLAASAGVSLVSAPTQKWRVAIFALLCGLAIASKEFAVLPVGALFGLVAGALIIGRRLAPMNLAGFFCLWAVIVSFSYLATFVPLVFAEKYKARSFLDVMASLQAAIWKYQWLEVKQIYDHPYNSEWWQWPLLIRPMWFHYGKLVTDSSYARGVFMLGNPLVMWGGLISVVYCVYTGLRGRNRVPLALALMYVSLVLCWPLIARKEAFYYYYVPAGMVLGFTLTFSLSQLRLRFAKAHVTLRNVDVLFVIVCACVFAEFYPVYSGQLIPDANFMRWIWLESWI